MRGFIFKCLQIDCAESVSVVIMSIYQLSDWYNIACPFFSDVMLIMGTMQTLQVP